MKKYRFCRWAISSGNHFKDGVLGQFVQSVRINKACQAFREDLSLSFNSTDKRLKRDLIHIYSYIKQNANLGRLLARYRTLSLVDILSDNYSIVLRIEKYSEKRSPHDPVKTQLTSLPRPHPCLASPLTVSVQSKHTGGQKSRVTSSFFMCRGFKEKRAYIQALIARCSRIQRPDLLENLVSSMLKCCLTATKSKGLFTE